MTIDVDTFNSDAQFHGTKGLIRINDKIVVLRRDAKTLHYPLQIDLPGGGREGQESPFETLQREIMEELHIPITKDDIIFSKRYQNPPSASNDTFFMTTRELNVTEKSIIFGDKGLMHYCMSIHDFLYHPSAVNKQKDRIINYLEAVKSELV